MSEPLTEKIISFDGRGNKENRPTHARSTSMQNEFNKSSFANRHQKEDT